MGEPSATVDTPRFLEWGTGYATRYAGWTLARLGFSVVRIHGGSAGWVDEGKTSISAGEAPDLLPTVDGCLVDADSGLRDVFDPEGPRPSDLVHLNVVELGVPVTDPQANALIGARSGVSAAIGEADGPALTPPGRMLEALVGLQAAAAALATAFASRRDGCGENVTVDPVECVAGIAGVNAVQYLNYGLRWRRAGASASGSGGPYPFRVFRADDGEVVVLARSRDEWEAFLGMLGPPEWADDPRFGDQLTIARDHADEVSALIEKCTKELRVDELAERAREARVPLAPIRSLAEVLGDDRLMEAGRPVPLPAVRFDSLSVGAVRTRPPVPVSDPAAPLDGVRVLDLGWVWAAPIAAAWLADLGANVVKVESRGRLDVARRRGVEFPAALGYRPELPPHERALVFDAANRNKRSVELDLKDRHDRDAFLALVDEADVVVESFAGGVLERLELAPAALIDRNSDLLVVSMGGASGDEEFVSRSYAPVLSAMAGIESAVRGSDGRAIGMMNWGGSDASGGCWGLLAVLAALVRGVGGIHLKVSQLRGIANTCAALYCDKAGAEPVEIGAAEVTPEHLAGTATDELGDVYRAVTVRSWDPRTGERLGFAPPWRFGRRPVSVRRGAPLLGSSRADEILHAWATDPVAVSTR